MGLALPQLAPASQDRVSGTQVIKGSLKFDDNSSHYLNITPGSTSNRRTWTASFWTKSNPSGSTKQTFLQCRVSDNTDDTGIGLENDKIRVVTGTVDAYITSRVLRDPCAWYHIAVVFDTTQSTDSDRVKVYVNSELDTGGTTSYPSQNTQWSINTTSSHAIGRHAGVATQYIDAYISQFYLIDGLALGPGYFGFTDPLTNTWKPRKFKAEGTTVNDGTVWSSLASVSSGSFQGSYPATNAFNGTLTSSDRANGDTNGSSIDLDFSGKNIIVKNDIAIWSGKSSMRYSINGGEYISYSDATEKWKTILFSGRLVSLKIKHGSDSEQPGFSGLAVDGVTMLDSTTTNLAFGTNGFYLPMENADDFEIDKSGKGNNWTKNSFSGTSINPDVLKDSPSGAVSGGRAQTGITTTSSAPANYATLNPLNINDMGGTTSVTISDGNLTVANARNTYFGTALSNLSMTSGKYYCEGTVDSNDATTLLCGILKIDPLESRWNTDDEQIGYSQYGYGYRSNNGNKENNLSNSSYGDSYGDGDTIGIALDLDAKTISFYKNGTNQGVAYSGIPAGEYAFGFSSSETNNKWKANFGQKPFKYAPPKGFLPLNTSNTRSLSVITRPNQYVGVATYIGSGNSSQDIIFGFKPDFAWTKSRTTAENHGLFDSVRGLPKFLRSDSTDDEYTLAAGTPVSFISNGINFTNGSGEINESTRGYVAWAWKAGGDKNTFNVDDVGYASASAAGLDSGSINPTGASVGTKQGFSILKFTAPSDSGTKTISHGLSQTPEFYIFKETNRNSTAWYIFHHSVCDTNTKFLRFDTTALQSGAGNVWGNLPTSSLVSIQNGSLNAVSSQNILYAWHSVPGLQKFGTYTGNGSADGPFVELSFRPSIVWIRRTDSGQNWAVHDSERDKSNECDKNLAFNLSSVENNSGDIGTADANEIDFLSNGFKLRDSAAVQNADGGTYIYCAWAEASTSGLFGGGANAR